MLIWQKKMILFLNNFSHFDSFSDHLQPIYLRIANVRISSFLNLFWATFRHLQQLSHIWRLWGDN